MGNEVKCWWVRAGEFAKGPCARILAAFIGATLTFGCSSDEREKRASTQTEQVGQTQQAASSPEAGCTQQFFSGGEYWFCNHDRDWLDARAHCQAVGLDLVRIGGPLENDFVRSRVNTDTWIGANDRATEGTWVWTIGGQQFWQGGSNGSAVGGLFSSWDNNAPNSQDCAQIFSNGEWKADSCSNDEEYVCEQVADNCPNDPEKSEPGACGCGTPDSDSDGDGTPDCSDGCPNDAGRVAPGDCGCANAPKPAGTACGDGLCSANAQCDGAGTCGNPQDCAPDTNCTLKRFNRVPYWFCREDRPWDDARTRCQAVRMDLVQIESEPENDFVRSNAQEDSHIGATDTAVEGAWRWALSQQHFWQGDENTGAPVAGAYNAWDNDEPDAGNAQAEDCAEISRLNGDWKTVSCSASEAYVCEQVAGIAGPDGGRVTSDDGKAELRIPPGALTQTLLIDIQRASIEASVPYSGLIPGAIYSFTPNNLQFAQPATLTIEYDPSQVPVGIDEGSLIILSSDRNRGETFQPLDPWEERPSSADANANRVTTQISHFSHDGVGAPVTTINATPAQMGLIPLTRQTIAIETLTQDGSPVVHAVDWSSDAPTVVAAAQGSIPAFNQGILIAGNVGSGSATVTATVRNTPPAVNAVANIPVTVGLSTLTIQTPNSSTSRNDLNDAVTIAYSASSIIDLPNLNFSDATGSATFSAFTYLGQELTVFEMPFYGMQPDDLGGANVSGSFSATHAWPFLTGARFSTMHLAPGETDTMNYNHTTGHVVRYVRGTCSQRIPWSDIFTRIKESLLSSMTCDAQSAVFGLVSVTQRRFEAQPHFRGRVGLALPNQAPAEMGFFFDADYDARVPVINAGITVGMNPGYSMKRTPDGFVNVCLINDRPNVRVVNDTERDGVLVSATVRDRLRNEFPRVLSREINRQLVAPLPAPLNTACTLGDATAPQACFDATMNLLRPACDAGLIPAACIATQVLRQDNFRCVDSGTGSGTCGFHPIVQQVNVLPEELELVFAPDPFRPEAQLDQLFRAISAISGTQICGPAISTATRTNRPIAGLQEANATITPASCADDPNDQAPPVVCP